MVALDIPRVAHGPQIIQFSTFKPRTRSKSFALLITTVASRVLAWAAIMKSFALIIWPFFFRSERISA